MNTYAYRSEADIDISRFETAAAAAGIPIANRTIVSEGVLDRCVQFDSPAELDKLIEIASTVIDGHIIVRTLREGTIAECDLGEYVRLE